MIEDIPAGERFTTLSEPHRDRRNGQYTFDGDWARLCVCGHTLGVHGGEAPHDCLAGTNCLNDPHPGVFCDCQKFRPAKPRRAAQAAPLF